VCDILWLAQSGNVGVPDHRLFGLDEGNTKRFGRSVEPFFQTVSPDKTRVDGVYLNTVFDAEFRGGFGKGEQRRVDRAADCEFGSRGTAADSGDVDDRAGTSRTVPKNFSAKLSCQSSSLRAKKAPRLVAPALFTTISILPNCSTAASTRRAGASSSRRSAGKTKPSLPDSRILATTSLNFWASRAARTTFAPFWARLRAMALPIPRLAPVTMATRFVKRFDFMFVSDPNR